MKPLGQRLVEAGLINDTQPQSALREQQKTREYLARIPIRLGYVREEAVAAALPAQARVNSGALGQYSPQPEALQLVQEKFAREHHLVPLSYVGKVLVVAMANPLDIITIDELRRMSKGPVEVVGATQGEVLEALDRAYGVGVGAAWNEVVEHSLRHVMGRRGAGGTETDVAQEPPVIRLVDSLTSRRMGGWIFNSAVGRSTSASRPSRPSEARTWSSASWIGQSSSWGSSSSASRRVLSPSSKRFL